MKQTGSAVLNTENFASGAVHGNSAQLVVDRFKSFYQCLNRDTLDTGELEKLYGEDLVFEDSFHRIEGRNEFKAYCRNLYENVQHIQFVFHDEWVKDRSAVLTWTMTFSHPRLKGGKPVQVSGASEIRFTDKVTHHRDYFDGGALLYEHIPLLGSVVQQLKKRLS